MTPFSQTLLFISPSSEVLSVVCCLLFSSLLAEIQKKKKFFLNLWKRLIALCKSRYYCHISKMWMPNSLGLWYTQMVFLFCISANVITKYNKFSSKVIRTHLASSPICPTCYLLITLWGDVVVLLLLWAKWPRVNAFSVLGQLVFSQ